ncbi:DUF72 domain-containing protein, partial [Kaarinaea lacus]
INLERLQEFTQTLQKWPQTRHVIEFRHPSWFVDAVATCLQRQGVAVCLSDAPDWPMWDEVTTDLVYIRFHGHTVTYESSYSSKQLSQWANRINLWRHQGKDVYAYFDNDAACAAPYNAIELLQRVNS